jgi:hypothetical protein
MVNLLHHEYRPAGGEADPEHLALEFENKRKYSLINSIKDRQKIMIKAWLGCWRHNERIGYYII